MRNAKLDGVCTQTVKGTQKDMVSCREVWGVLPQRIFGSEGHKWYIPTLFWATLPQYQYMHPLKISLQIYTDLKNGPGSWKKV